MFWHGCRRCLCFEILRFKVACLISISLVYVFGCHTASLKVISFIPQSTSSKGQNNPYITISEANTLHIIYIVVILRCVVTSSVTYLTKTL